MKPGAIAKAVGASRMTVWRALEAAGKTVAAWSAQSQLRFNRAWPHFAKAQFKLARFPTLISESLGSAAGLVRSWSHRLGFQGALG